eukprot:m.14238 g.14238  ORF g.14238 m.14238 type:complete len:337 (-) comp4765_c0_seq1:4391-5401(-)
MKLATTTNKIKRKIKKKQAHTKTVKLTKWCGWRTSQIVSYDVEVRRLACKASVLSLFRDVSGVWSTVLSGIPVLRRRTHGDSGLALLHLDFRHGHGRLFVVEGLDVFVLNVDRGRSDERKHHGQKPQAVEKRNHRHGQEHAKVVAANKANVHGGDKASGHDRREHAVEHGAQHDDQCPRHTLITVFAGCGQKLVGNMRGKFHSHTNGNNKIGEREPVELDVQERHKAVEFEIDHQDDQTEQQRNFPAELKQKGGCKHTKEGHAGDKVKVILDVKVLLPQCVGVAPHKALVRGICFPILFSNGVNESSCLSDSCHDLIVLKLILEVKLSLGALDDKV